MFPNITGLTQDNCTTLSYYVRFRFFVLKMNFIMKKLKISQNHEMVVYTCLV